MTRALSVGVVIPVHNEESSLDACLTSVRRAAARVRDRCRTEVVVVLDGCTDASERIASCHDVMIVQVDERRVGAARRAGVAALTARARDRLWVANTDGDSTVPTDWLENQLSLADGGADVVLGNVRPDFVGLSPAHIAYWHATHPPGIALGNVHGANLGFRASVYDTVGGFDDLAQHEDVDLVRRARESGATVVATAIGTVETSSRMHGRTPGGYAEHLRGVARLFLDRPSTVDVVAPGSGGAGRDVVPSAHG